MLGFPTSRYAERKYLLTVMVKFSLYECLEKIRYFCLLRSYYFNYCTNVLITLVSFLLSFPFSLTNGLPKHVLTCVIVVTPHSPELDGE